MINEQFISGKVFEKDIKLGVFFYHIKFESCTYT